MLQIYAVKISEKFNLQTLMSFSCILPVERQEKIPRFIHEIDAMRSLIGDLLIRSLIFRHLGLLPHEIQIITNRYGKPYLQHNKSFHFNISHSGDWIICAVDEKPVGIDIEKIEKLNVAIAAEFFAPEENSNLQKKNEEEKLLFFYRYWSLKESYSKALGLGLSLPFHQFSIQFIKNEILVKSDVKHPKCYFKEYHLADEYVMSLCTFQSYFPEEVQILPLKQLYDFSVYANQKI
ncbi:4'-phosphopantetheinyl transferase [Bacillus pseudomycoides]|uniref:4'-phosphopantetheinyl transferase family protein n=1 Tax=Bacillus pseudomycoides TaxID=64104 RepID=UPI000BECF3FF|nr:4'-phosphopantetheinyl transferase superfamily protein [Bacillus pseudomycoides]PEF72423.1 4'-phosphopantetheinyl transferase [Bacillus pseudomycoides]PEL85536.1 4'-phosphopantetheinyl transferase [Bacillus pseudomycoides]